MRLLRQIDVSFGGINIMFAGDFHQLLPFNNKPLYDNRDSLLWRGQVKVVIRLQTNHRFKDDPCFGELLDRYRKNEWTLKDIDTINKRMIDDDKDIVPYGKIGAFYACSIDKDRNVISTRIFTEHVQRNHPDANEDLKDLNDCDRIPLNVVILEGTIYHSETKKEVARKFSIFIQQLW